MHWVAKNTRLFLILSLSLGLAPFVPEPHIWGKLRWIVGGANGMQLMDWGDFLLHGTPWVLLFLSLVLRFTYKPKQS